MALVISLILILAIPLGIGFVFPNVKATWVGIVAALISVLGSTINQAANQAALRSLGDYGVGSGAPIDEWLFGVTIAAIVRGLLAYATALLGSKLRRMRDGNLNMTAPHDDPAYKYLPSKHTQRNKVRMNRTTVLAWIASGIVLVLTFLFIFLPLFATSAINDEVLFSYDNPITDQLSKAQYDAHCRNNGGSVAQIQPFGNAMRLQVGWVCLK